MSQRPTLPHRLLKRKPRPLSGPRRERLRASTAPVPQRVDATRTLVLLPEVQLQRSLPPRALPAPDRSLNLSPKPQATDGDLPVKKFRQGTVSIESEGPRRESRPPRILKQRGPPPLRRRTQGRTPLRGSRACRAPRGRGN